MRNLYRQATALAIVFVITISISAGFIVKAAQTININAGDDFQAKTNSAQCGDTVLVQAGAAFPTSADNGFVLATRCPADNPILMQSTRLSELPAGKRIDAPDAPKMFAIKAAGKTPALTVSGSGWKIRGMEVAPTDRSVYRSILVTASGDDLDFDRTYVHTLEDGTTKTDSSAKIGYNLTGNRIVIHESRMSYFPAYQLNSKLVDNTYPVLMTTGDGVTIENSFLGGQYNNIFFGGSQFGGYTSATVAAGATMSQATLSTTSNLKAGDLIAFQQSANYWGAAKVAAINGNVVQYAPFSTTSPLTIPPPSGAEVRWNGSVPSHVVLRRNRFWKDPVSTKIVIDESPNPLDKHNPKGDWEVKSVEWMLVEANVFDGWPSNLAFLVVNQNQPNGCWSVWSRVRHVMIRNNLFKKDVAYNYGALRFSLITDYYCASSGGGDINVENNLFETGGAFALGAGENISIRHNTLLTDGSAGSLIDNNAPAITNGVLLLDNIAVNNEYGLQCQANRGPNGLGCYGALDMRGNAIIGPRLQDRPWCGAPYPAGNICLESAAGLFTDPASGNYRVTASSGLKGKASDGKDPGIDQDVLDQALAGTLPPTPSPSPTPAASPTPSPTPAASPSPSPTPSPTPSANLALNGTVTASSIYGAGYAPSSLTNGDRAGLQWGSDGGWNDATMNLYPDWIEIAFAGGVRTLSQIDVYTLQDNYTAPVAPTDAMTFATYGITDFVVQYWNGTAWTTVGTATGNNKVKRSFSFPAVQTTKIRVQINGSLGGYSRLTEVEAYGPSPSSPSPGCTWTVLVSTPTEFHSRCQ